MTEVPAGRDPRLIAAGHNFDADRLTRALSVQAAQMKERAAAAGARVAEALAEVTQPYSGVADVRGHRVTWTETIRKTAVFYYGIDEHGLVEADGSVNDAVVEMLVVDLEDPPDTEEVVERTIESVEVLM